MYTLGIDLQEGFERDSIVIEVNGKEIFQKENVGTQLLLGYADTFSLKVPEGTSEVKIRLPLKNMEETISLKINSDTYVGVSINSGNIEYIISEKPFYYQ